ncbi:MAG: phospho-N-acetylmuramoyl-pentapeptide-transferase [Deltaproteobacteria bacterium]|nr:phospho-N-acetylmuramoyl-pentapeptide-transferase [Deltaproteobacteria bacterium]
MLYYLLFGLKSYFSVFNVFRYPTFRMVIAAVISFVIVYFMIPKMIKFFRQREIGQNIRDDGPETHLKKAGTPTMGGIAMLVAIITSTVLWADYKNMYIIVSLVMTTGFGLVGFVDDLLKFKNKSSKGLSGKVRLLIEFSLVFITFGIIIKWFGFDTRLSLPFIKTEIFHPDIGYFYLILSGLVIVGTANALNLTDGLDGLAIGPTLISATAFLILTYGAGTVLAGFNVAEYLKIAYIDGAGELTVFIASIIGAGIGFLWYNFYPAEIFMGDVGSLSLGAALGTVAVLIKMEFVSMIVNGLFLLEALSVIMQVVSYQTVQRRIFKMAPLHHHFEKKGWPETKVIIRFWIIAIIMAILGVATLKLR